MTAKVTDGIVLAADSASSFFDETGARIKIYNNANKVFNLVKTQPIAAMVYGCGSIGASSVETLTKDLRTRLSDSKNDQYGIDLAAYTIKEVAEKARRFLYEECYKAAYPDPDPKYLMGYRVCGYSASQSLAEVWEFSIVGADCLPPYQIQGTESFGVRWAGENEPLDRLVLGVPGALDEVLAERGVPADEARKIFLEVIRRSGWSPTLPAMPIQDAIDVAKFLVETACGYAKFGIRAETIGGPIEIAAITKYEGFKWISRKHYYARELNGEVNHVR